MNNYRTRRGVPPVEQTFQDEFWIILCRCFAYKAWLENDSIFLTTFTLQEVQPLFLIQIMALLNQNMKHHNNLYFSL
ncbi:MAG: hypothetical protein QNJ63_29045 [Calothrix sp. MO_192.B10]|nr:hypothetical protein [Calothrix sp. MO_192.B10]